MSTPLFDRSVIAAEKSKLTAAEQKIFSALSSYLDTIKAAQNVDDSDSSLSLTLPVFLVAVEVSLGSVISGLEKAIQQELSPRVGTFRSSSKAILDGLLERAEQEISSPPKPPQPKCPEKVALVPDQGQPVSGPSQAPTVPYEAPSPPKVKSRARPDRSLPTGVHKCTTGHQATIWLGKSNPYSHKKSLCLGVYDTPALAAYVRNLVISHLGLPHPLEPNVPNPGPRIREKVIASASRRLVNYGLNPIII